MRRTGNTRTGNAVGNGVDAAAALDLLECDPSSIMWSKGGGSLGSQARSGGRQKSAAQLAREQYEAQAQERQARQAPVDLLDLDSPAQAAASSASGVQLLDMGQAGQAGGQQTWPGEVVLARYGPHGGFYRARVVRVYSSRGSSLADVEWLRPQAGCIANAQFLSTSGMDETLHRNGLQVGVDTRSLNAGTADGSRAPALAAVSMPPPPLSPLAPSAPASVAVLPPSRAAAAPGGSSAPVADLLDFQGPEAGTQDLLGGDAVVSTSMPGGLGGVVFPSTQTTAAAAAWGSPSSSPTATGAMNGTATGQAWTGLGQWPQQPTQMIRGRASQQERFGFVSDMISQASDSSAANING